MTATETPLVAENARLRAENARLLRLLRSLVGDVTAALDAIDHR